MENLEIVRILNEHAELLEIRDENPFRVRSYRKAAQTVAGLLHPVAQPMGAGEDLTELPGIGTKTAANLRRAIAQCAQHTQRAAGSRRGTS